MKNTDHSLVLQPLLRVLGFLLLFLAIASLSRRNYLVFHTGIEILSVIVAWSIFAIASNTHRYSRNSYFMFLGLAYVFIGSLDLLHAMAYQGMGIFLIENTANLATQLWISARLFESAAIVASTVYFSRTINIKRVFLVNFIIFVTLLHVIFVWGNFPLCFISTSGLTLFKIVSEYIISLLFLAGIILTIVNKKSFQDKGVYAKIIIAYSISIAAELTFTTYFDLYGTLNMLGHYLKLISFFYVYEALVKSNLHLPHQQLQLVNERLSQAIAQRDVIETKRQRYEYELNRLSKLETIATLAGGLAHDFRNLLTIVLGNANLAEMQTSDKGVRTNLKHIADAARQGTELANRLLTFTKDGDPIKEPVDLLVLARDTTELALSGTKVKASFSAPESSLLAEVDSTQICQVVHNIVINAVQAMPWGGFLSIDLHRARVNPESESLPIAPGEYIIISFKDHGLGIAKDNLEHIFVPFFTTKKDGSGMGLATCFTIVKKHSGYISVDSERGLGTTFTIYLPAYSSSTTVWQEVAAAATPPKQE